jgi:2-amino-4-hydroxy-6-hydroxymethyldihydropteridine diphosphokinase
VPAVLSLGSNLGDRRAHLQAALDLLSADYAVRVVSPLYETSPIGVDEQPAYLNCVAVADVPGAEAALAFVARAETMRGRLRSARWGPRTLDVDVIDVDGLSQDDPRLTLPHPRAHLRAFVLRPWLDVDPDAELTSRGPVWWLMRGLDGQQVTQVPW